MKYSLALIFIVLTSCNALPRDPVSDKMKTLFPQFDADRDNALSPEEQTRAVAFVKTAYGETWSQRIQNMFAHAAAPDKAISAAKWQAQVEAYGRPPTVRTARIPMRDGNCLATDIYMPNGDGPFSVVLLRTPYGKSKNGSGAGDYTREGFVYVQQDMRGRFDSEGENFPFIGCGWGEHQDGADTLAWLRKQPWCNGNIGTIGGSACGITQNLLAGAVPEGLKAQYISVAAASLYSDASYIGGAFRKADVEGWLRGNTYDPQVLALFHAHPTYDGYWQTLDTTLKFTQMNTPAVHIGGWFDMFAQATIDAFVGRQYGGASGARGAQKLIMGPWTHGIGKMPAGEFQFPNATAVPERYGASRWFTHYLSGIDNGVEKEPAVAYYVMGDAKTPGAPGNEWRFAEDWPVPATETAAFFTREGALTLKKPTGDADAYVEYTFDPTNPCPTIGGNNLTLARGPLNQNGIEGRSDMVLFTTAPLAEPIEVTGPVKADVFIASSAVDTDLSVRLCDVYPDGKSYLIAEGILRLRYRHSIKKTEPLTPGKIEDVIVDCWSTSIVFNKGHRIRAAVTSSNYPRFDVNPGTGAPGSDSGAKVRQTNRIYCDAEHASRLLLPVVYDRKAASNRTIPDEKRVKQ